MSLKIEITPSFAHDEDANTLLYTPRVEKVRCRRTKVYLIQVEGDVKAFETWMRRVVFDEVSQSFHIGDAPALDGAKVILEYGMKPGALDHEREMILEEYHREGDAKLGFSLPSFVIRTRIYLFADDSTEVDPAPYVRDIVNGAVHTHRVILCP